MTMALPSSLQRVSHAAGGITRYVPRWVLVSIGLLAAWQLISLAAGKTYAGANMVPSPADVVGAAKLFGNYWPGGLGLERTATGAELTWAHAGLALLYNTALTLFRLFSGFVLGILLGAGLAAAVSWSPAIRQMVAFPAHLARMLPLLALVPLFNLWWGNTEMSAILFVGLVTFCAMFASAVNAIGKVPRDLPNYARSLGARPARVYFRVILPAAMPRINVGIRVAHGFAWGGVVAAEFLGLQYGLGRIVMMAQDFNQFSLLSAAAIAIVCLAVLTSVLLANLLHKLTRWE